MAKKIYVITVSKVFPKGHPREGEETGFVEKLIRGEKIHTIRENFEYWSMVADKVNAGTHVLSFRTWNGVPYDSKQTEFMELSSFFVQPVKFWHTPEELKTTSGGIELWNSEVAKNDGLAVRDFVRWFFPKQTKTETKECGILHFTDFRY